MAATQIIDDPAVVIVGAGLAGLACAGVLQRQRIAYVLLEADDRVGGRIKTDHVNGYRLDHGFQVLQAAYPEARSALDYRALALSAFDPGVMIRIGERFYAVADPLRMPRHLLSGLRAPIGSIADKLRFARLAGQLSRQPLTDLFDQPESPTPAFLRSNGFSDRIIERFFRPFFGGITLDPQIRASNRMFTYVLQMFATGDVVLPARGMASIPEQLAADIPAARLLTGRKVSGVAPRAVILENGEQMATRHVVLATDAPATVRLLDLAEGPASCATACVYFSAEKPPVSHKLLLLNGNGDGPVNNLSIPSLVAPRYAPPGRCLMAATVLEPYLQDTDHLEAAVRSQLKGWFGQSVERWEHLRTYFIEHALPLQAPPLPNPFKTHKRKIRDIWIAGEYGYPASIQWSLYAGRRTGEQIVEKIRAFEA